MYLVGSAVTNSGFDTCLLCFVLPIREQQTKRARPQKVAREKRKRPAKIERFRARAQRAGPKGAAAGGTVTTHMKADIAQRRSNNAVAGVGIIETGLEGRERSRKSSISDPVGRVLVQKCEVNKSGLYNSLKRVWNRCSSGKDGVKTTLLHPMKITIPEGITAIIGTAESGKSTLLKFMAGCLNNNVECVGDGESYCYLHTVILCSDLWINTAMFCSSLSVLTS